MDTLTIVFLMGLLGGVHCLGVWALWIPAKSLILNIQHSHHAIEVPKPTDLDYLV